MMPDPSHARPLRWLLVVALGLVVLGGYAHADTSLYVTVYVPWAPEGEQRFIYRINDERFTSLGQCRELAPGIIDDFMKAAAGRGIPPIIVEQTHCIETEAGRVS
jgi:hypothetical protein